MKNKNVILALLFTYGISFSLLAQFSTYSASNLNHSRHTNAGNVVIGG